MTFLAEGLTFSRFWKRAFRRPRRTPEHTANPEFMGGDTIETIDSVQRMQTLSAQALREGRSIALVPTMGYLHEGHATLIREAAKHGDMVVVSVFVNPTQFAPTEDLSTYPRDLERDLKVAGQAGATVVFTPTAEDIYGEGFQTYVSLERLPLHLCGLSRPTHFRGVATVVSKLFHIVRPHVAVFGEKDFQQLVIVRRMVADLHFDIDIVGVPIVRESDGLAMSSRNVYLTPDQRRQALCLRESALAVAERAKNGERDAARLVELARDIILRQPETRIDYVTICDPDTLEDVTEISRPTLMALAVFVGKTRLIDNIIVNPR